MSDQILTLREAATLAGITPDTRVDFERGIVYDVVLLGRKSQNLNTEYTDPAIQDAFQIVESTGSYIDHPAGESNARSIRENFGRFKGPYKNTAGELCAKEYHYNLRSSFAPEFEWMLKNIPHRIGFSINADGVGRTDHTTGIRLVERITKTHSFDLVDGPATTNNIFNLRESLQKLRIGIDLSKPKQTSRFFIPIREQSNMFDATITTAFQEVADGVKNQTLGPAEAIAAVKKILKLLGDNGGENKPAEDVEAKASEEVMSVQESDKKIIAALDLAAKSKYKYVGLLATQLDGYRLRERQEKEKAEKEAVTNKRVTAAKEKLKDESLITAVFREQLANAKDDTEVNALIEDRAKFSLREQNDTPPRSVGQTNTGKVEGEMLKGLTSKYFG
jgi:hypothetical protein